jgi:hypothetical protein
MLHYVVTLLPKGSLKLYVNYIDINDIVNKYGEYTFNLYELCIVGEETHLARWREELKRT